MLYFSIFSGELYESDDVRDDPHQIPLIKRPKDNCKKCHGRFYTDYNLTTKQYTVCNKCLRTCLNVQYVIDSIKTHETKKRNH